MAGTRRSHPPPIAVASDRSRLEYLDTGTFETCTTAPAPMA